MPFRRLRLKLQPMPGESLEARARAARYAALRGAMHAGEVLLTAHHRDDQLETLLLQALRGAGLRGLAGIAADGESQGLALRRPLLPFARRELEAWLRSRKIFWVEDDSNADPRFDRNYLRTRVVPLLEQRWPAASAVAARSAAHLAEANRLLAEFTAADLHQLTRDDALDAVALARLSVGRQRNLLRAWLRRQGAPTPDAVHLERIRVELAAVRRDGNPQVTWSDAAVRRYRGVLYCEAPRRVVSALAQPVHWRTRSETVCGVGAGNGSLHLIKDSAGAFDRPAAGSVWTVRHPAAAERVWLAGESRRRRLSELLRAAGVLPWRRESVPIVFDEARCIAIASLALRPASGSGTRYRIEWRDAPRSLAMRFEPPSQGTSASPDSENLR